MKIDGSREIRDNVYIYIEMIQGLLGTKRENIEISRISMNACDYQLINRGEPCQQEKINSVWWNRTRSHRLFSSEVREQKSSFLFFPCGSWRVLLAVLYHQILILTSAFMFHVRPHQGLKKKGKLKESFITIKL